jgi:hypothetical protein
LPHFLSVTNKHPASTLSLEEVSTPDDLITMITDSVAENKKMCLSTEFAWAKSHIDGVTVFLEDLLGNIR